MTDRSPHTPRSVPGRIAPRERALIDSAARESAEYTVAELAKHAEVVRKLALEMDRLLTMDDLKILFGFKTDEPIVRLIKDGTLKAVKVGKEWRTSWDNYRAACDQLFDRPAQPRRIRRKAKGKTSR